MNRNAEGGAEAGFTPTEATGGPRDRGVGRNAEGGAKAGFTPAEAPGVWGAGLFTAPHLNYQYSLTANCISRTSPRVDVMRPNVAVFATLAPGSA